MYWLAHILQLTSLKRIKASYCRFYLGFSIYAQYEFSSNIERAKTHHEEARKTEIAIDKNNCPYVPILK